MYLHALEEPILKRNHAELAHSEEGTSSLRLRNVVVVGAERLQPLQFLDISSCIIIHLNVFVLPEGVILSRRR